MEDKLKEKLKQKDLENKLKLIYKKICTLNINIGFLHNYCKAYSDKDGIYYFTPFTEYLEESLIEIGREFYNIFGYEKVKVKDEFLKNITPLNQANNIIIED